MRLHVCMAGRSSTVACLHSTASGTRDVMGLLGHTRPSREALEQQKSHGSHRIFTMPRESEPLPTLPVPQRRDGEGGGAGSRPSEV